MENETELGGRKEGKGILSRIRRVGRRPGLKLKGAPIIGAFSCKGGVGKTTIISNLAVGLGEIFEGKVLAVDTNLSAPNLNIHFGLIEPIKTIHDVLAGQIPIEDAIQKSCGIDVIYGSIGIGEEVYTPELRSYLQPLRKAYTVILLDTAPGLGGEVLSALRACDEILVITEPEVPTVASTLKTFHAAERYRVPVVGTVVNKIMNEPYELPTGAIKKALGWPVIAGIPYDKRIRESVAEGVPIIRYRPKTQVAREFRRLAELIANHIKG